jgi:hypothetical protein
MEEIADRIVIDPDVMVGKPVIKGPLPSLTNGSILIFIAYESDTPSNLTKTTLSTISVVLRTSRISLGGT